MPIKIPDNLPATTILEREGVEVISETRAMSQDIRPLRIGLLNLMPDKPQTEVQFARLLGATLIQVDLTFVSLESHTPKTTQATHMAAFYSSWERIRSTVFDGFIITGAPVEALDYAQVYYWDELRRILDWTQTHVHSTMTICWSAQAALAHFRSVPKHILPEKCSGVYNHRNLAPASPYLRGFSDEILIPVSRQSEIRVGDLPKDEALQMLLTSDEAGLCLIEDSKHRTLHMFNHLEYDTYTLAGEYNRDRRTSPQVRLPHNYYPHGDMTLEPLNRWRSHAHLFFNNWITQTYKSTPFDIDKIGT